MAWVRTMDRNPSSAASALDSWMKPTMGIDDNHTEDHRGIDVFAQSRGNQPGCEQDVDERMVKLPQNAHQQAAPRSHRQGVGSKAF
ncbi:ATPase, P-type (Transporting), HAD super, subfamily IC domain protein [Mycobacterium kansasii 662]|uniref:ATPase, P-type (Transporting), HAD super, subfamily IC domain protein n=1 Tax=Mycobacterium kansasii 662 TaxID=1299326 RepID=X7Z9K2_MYCKA|nr:ATPase, P-type (Transporting), HAD super, subfamily IC domain protein [Mycobacterium kansasii 662]